MKETTGTIIINYDVSCPHCEETMYSDIDRDWWDETFGSDFGSDEWDFKSDFTCKCKECETEFQVIEFNP